MQLGSQTDAAANQPKIEPNTPIAYDANKKIMVTFLPSHVLVRQQGLQLKDSAIVLELDEVNWGHFCHLAT